MSTITSLLGSGVLATDRTTINTNFSNLNTDKIETSTLDTDTTLAANSDAKIATQKAVKAYVDAGGNVNASETTKGIVEEATDAEVTAGTATGGTGAKLFVTPAKLKTRTDALIANASTTVAGMAEEATQAEVDAGTTTGGTGARLFINPGSLRNVTSLHPHPASSATGYGNLNNNNSNTKLTVGRVIVPVTIRLVTKVTFNVTSYNATDTIKVCLFSEDGQTQVISFTTANVTGTGLVSTTITATTVPAGVYYIAWVPSSNAQCTLGGWQEQNIALNHVTSEPVYCGYVTVSAGVMPSTITPGSLTFEASGSTLDIQLDN